MRELWGWRRSSIELKLICLKDVRCVFRHRLRVRLGFYAYAVRAVVLFAVHCNLFASLGLILRLWRLNVAELYANSLEQTQT